MKPKSIHTPMAGESTFHNDFILLNTKNLLIDLQKFAKTIRI
jgi:hypothetical protein